MEYQSPEHTTQMEMPFTQPSHITESGYQMEKNGQMVKSNKPLRCVRGPLVMGENRGTKPGTRECPYGNLSL